MNAASHLKTAAVALNRYGLGARPNDPLPEDPKRWLLAQLDAYEPLPGPWKSQARTSTLVRAWTAQQRAVRQAPENERSGIREAYLRQGRDAYLAAVGARATSALHTSTPFLERLVHFWANHFAVSVDKLLIIGMAGGYEADAIRPHIMGRFEDMLLAAVRHPAMLLYLDQARSTGPNSMAGRRAATRQNAQGGLNENLAREILELHTLGVRSGYTQADVTELSLALTGWTLPGDDASDGTFRFVLALHEPGSRKVLGRSYADEGEQQARAILHDLITAPATALHIARKLARHFVADDPPAELVQRLAATFSRTGGDMPSLYRDLVAAPQAWQLYGSKFKSPWEWTISGLRALGQRDIAATQVTSVMTQLGQPVWRPGAPTGFDDTAGAWAAPDALMHRVEVAQRLATQAGHAVDARALAPRVLPGVLGDATAAAIAKAESPATATALLLAAPEFLRR